MPVLYQSSFCFKQNYKVPLICLDINLTLNKTMFLLPKYVILHISIRSTFTLDQYPSWIHFLDTDKSVHCDVCRKCACNVPMDLCLYYGNME